ncbi:hypothetical protein PAPHI01_2126 [Pancytospora philotis]|nr:hypothetical protein PAPHI01_2126 [Pancytospora philotis]
MFRRFLQGARNAVCGCFSNPPAPSPCILSSPESCELCNSIHESVLMHATVLVSAIESRLADYLAFLKDVLSELAKAQQISPQDGHKAFLRSMAVLELGAMNGQIGALGSSLEDIVTQNYVLYAEAYRYLEIVKLHMCGGSYGPSQFLDLSVFKRLDCDMDEFNELNYGAKVGHVVVADVRFYTECSKLKGKIDALTYAQDHQDPALTPHCVCLSYIYNVLFQLDMLQLIAQPVRALITSSDALCSSIKSLDAVLTQTGDPGALDEDSARKAAEEVHGELEKCRASAQDAFDKLAEGSSSWVEDIFDAIAQVKTNEANPRLSNFMDD